VSVTVEPYTSASDLETDGLAAVQRYQTWYRAFD